MATIQKTTLKRFNGTDFDKVFLAGSADIIGIGKKLTVASGDGYTVGQEIAADTPVDVIIAAIINNLTKVDKVTIPALQNGSGITAIDASKITGTVTRDHLPADISGRGIEVDDEGAKSELTKDQVNIGDIVKVKNGKVYLVTAVEPAVTFMTLSDEAGHITWDRIDGKPTTLSGYGITDAINVSEVVTEKAPNKLLKLNGESKLPADITGDAATVGGHDASYFATATDHSALAGRVDQHDTDIASLKSGEAITALDAAKLTGTIDVERLPQAALERLMVVANKEARLALTKSDVQNGDVVKEEDTGLMYYVKDDSLLGAAEPVIFECTTEITGGTPVEWANITNPTGIKIGNYLHDTADKYYKVESVTEDTNVTPAASAEEGKPSGAEGAFEAFTAGAASSVPWSGITGKPTTLDGYGITDAVKSSEKNAAYGEGQIVVWKAGTDSESRTYQIEGKAKEAALAEMATDSKGLNGHSAAYFATSSDMETAKTDITNLKSGEAITALDAAKLTGTVGLDVLPDAVKFIRKQVANKAARLLLTKTDVQNGDLVKEQDTGALFFVIDDTQLSSDSGYEQISVTSLDWSKITGKPNTVDGYGITDAVKTTDTATTYEEGKVVKFNHGTNDTTSTDYDINAVAKKATEADQATKALDADKLGGNAPAYYATAQSVTDLTGRVGTAEGDITTIKSQIGDGSSSGILKDIKDLQSGSTIAAFDAAKLIGTIDIARLPKAAVERLYVTAAEEDLATLTTEQVQNGDTVKVQATGRMYFVKDDSKLGDPEQYMQAYEEYTVGTASQCDWSGIQNKPTTLAGYGITDAVAASEKVTEANAGNAGKILVLNAEGKLDVDITGHVEWDNILNKPTSTAEQIDQAVTEATHINRTVLDALADNAGTLQYNSKDLAKKEDLDATNVKVTENTENIKKLGLGVLSIVNNAEEDMPDAKVGQFVLELISAG